MKEYSSIALNSFPIKFKFLKGAILMLIFAGWSVNAQLIGNPSFETYTSLPNNNSQITRATGWLNSLGNFAGTPDYLNTLGTYNFSDKIAPKRGTGFAGIFLEYNSNSFSDYKEYLTRQLSSPLEAGATYSLSFYTAHFYGSGPAQFLPTGVTYDDLPVAERGYFGAVFSVAAPVASNTVGNITPRYNSIKNDFGVGRTLIPNTNTDVYGVPSRNSWVKVTLLYTAVGTEQYITLGQFRPGGTSLTGMNGVYYLYDAFSLNKVCTEPGVFDTAGEISMTGISDLDGFANGWPQNVPNGYIVMESRNSGFVITRVSSSASVLSPVEGMLIYDIADQCVKLYNGTIWNCLEKSCNE